MPNVYVLTDFSNQKRLDIVTNRLKSQGYTVIQVKQIGKLDITEDIIISTNEELQYPIFKNFVSSNIYFMLNDKIDFFNYLKNNLVLLQDGIQLIPHYDQKYNGPNLYKEFLLKDRKGYSAAFNKKMTGRIYDIIKMHGTKNQIQDVIDVKHILGVSASCLFGKILGVYSYKTNEAITNENLNSGFNAVRGNFIEDVSVRKFMKAFVEKINYFGIIEIEFLIDKKNIIYVMECNPRISGSLNIPPYFDWIIMPYIKNIQNRTLNEWDMNNKSLWSRI